MTPDPDHTNQVSIEVSIGLAASSQVPSPLGKWSKAGNLPFLTIIKVYRVLFSPILGGQCRFEPTCSRYAAEAYRLHGPITGSKMTTARICRCHPWNKGGFDPVQIPNDKPNDNPGDNPNDCLESSPTQPAQESTQKDE